MTALELGPDDDRQHVDEPATPWVDMGITRDEWVDRKVATVERDNAWLRGVLRQVRVDAECHRPHDAIAALAASAEDPF